MKRILSVMIAVSMSLTLCACETKQDDSQNAINMPNLEAKELSNVFNDDDYNQRELVARGVNEFAFDFTDKLLNDNQENFVCSPFSAWMPMAALANTVKEEYREEYLKSLYAEGFTCEQLNKTALSLLYDLTENKGLTKEDGEKLEPLQIVNAVFVDNDSTLNKDFAQKFLDNYRGRAMCVDFASDEAVKEVNQWASDNTKGLINNVVEKFDPNTVAAIANAIYYSDRWDWEFMESKNETIKFKTPNGEEDATFMVHDGSRHKYYEDDDMQVVKMNFVCGGSMYILLPKTESPEELLGSMTSEKLKTINDKFVYDATGILKFPKFKIAGDTFNITTALQEMGFPVFKNSNINGLCDDSELFISKAVQKAMIDVDEKGTTAAAVTIEVCESECEIQETDPFEMICDHPFAFVLTGNTNLGGETVLFTGVVNNPTV